MALVEQAHSDVQDGFPWSWQGVVADRQEKRTGEPDKRFVIPFIFFLSMPSRLGFVIRWFLEYSALFSPFPAGLTSVHAEGNAGFPIHGYSVATIGASNGFVFRAFRPVVSFGIR